ncbi:MAG: ornithine cyclodeaminase family protein [Candidatus Bathyarchaeota archaeon]|nr:ornithine cyclodeaminase family protein [Candidatus Bathyarchaeota archaeon]
MTLYLTQDEVKQVLDMKSTLEAVEGGFKEMGNDNIEMPPRVYLHFDKGVLIAMPAYMPGLNAAGTKIVTVHPSNKKDFGLPAVIARIILNSPANGVPLAIMDGTYITALRTGAAGATGIKYLSREDSEVVGVCGTGVQGRSQVMGLMEVRPKVKKIKVYDIIPEAMKAFAKEMGDMFPSVKFVTVSSAKEAAEGSDIVITCTPSPEAFIDGAWLKKGCHVSAIGADTGAKRELMTSAIEKMDKHVVDFIPQAFVVGDFKVPKEEGIIKEEDIYAELGEIVAGKKKGRESPDEITMFKATGLAIQDVGTASKVYELAKAKGVGMTLA